MPSELTGKSEVSEETPSVEPAKQEDLGESLKSEEVKMEVEVKKEEGEVEKEKTEEKVDEGDAASVSSEKVMSITIYFKQQSLIHRKQCV